MRVVQITIKISIPDEAYTQLLTFHTAQEIKMEARDAAEYELMDQFHAINLIENEKAVNE